MFVHYIKSLTKHRTIHKTHSAVRS